MQEKSNSMTLNNNCPSPPTCWRITLSPKLIWHVRLMDRGSPLCHTAPIAPDVTPGLPPPRALAPDDYSPQPGRQGEHDVFEHLCEGIKILATRWSSVSRDRAHLDRRLRPRRLHHSSRASQGARRMSRVTAAAGPGKCSPRSRSTLDS